MPDRPTPRPQVSRRLRGVFVFLAVLLAASVGAARTPAAAQEEEDTLREEATSTYTLVEGEDYVDVAVDVTITNKKPRRGWTIYYYNQYVVILPGTATDIAVTADGRELDFTADVLAADPEGLPDEEAGSLQYITIDLPRRLYYNKSQDLRVEFEIRGQDPRSSLITRINPAYVIFGVFAWGDPRLGTVEIVMGPGWDVDVFGEGLLLSFEDGRRVYRATGIEDPYEWYALVQARDESALEEESFEFVGIDVDVRSWPGDDEWSDDIASWLEQGFPMLQELVGIDVLEEDADLDIIEAAEPEYAGYAGWYDDDQDRIELGENADPHVLLHELAHLWCNEDLFVERWINEGFADQLSAEVVEDLGLADLTEFPEPEEPEWRRPWAFPLNEWVPPEGSPATDDQVRLEEEYGYEGSWWVIRSLYDEIGAEKMTEVIVAADADVIPYKGSGPREELPVPDDWRQFLDLLEEIGGSETAREIFETHVLDDDQQDVLEERESARAAYAGLLEADGEWETPLAIRRVMARWRFDTAEAWIEEAHAVLDKWGEVTTTAESMGLAAPNTMQPAYEAMTRDFGEALAVGDEQLETMAVMADAREVVGEERDFFVEIGLRGKDPEGNLAAADAAFEADDFGTALDESARAVALVEDAPRLGRERVKWAAVAAGGTLLLVLALLTLLIVWLVRRHRRGKGERAEEGEKPGDGERPDTDPAGPDPGEETNWAAGEAAETGED